MHQDKAMLVLVSSILATIILLTILALTGHAQQSWDYGPQILSAYLGIVDAQSPAPLKKVSGCEGIEANMEGMPVTFSVQIDDSTLSPEVFVITTLAGQIYSPVCATLVPADDPDELFTVLLVGDLGTADDLPASITIFDASQSPSLLSLDGEILTGLTIGEVTLSSEGPSLVMARWFPSQGQIQTVWQGGVTGPFGRELGLLQLIRFSIVDAEGESHIPRGFDDLNDGDNFIVLNVPEGVIPSRVEVPARTVYDPTNNPNPATSIEVMMIS